MLSSIQLSQLDSSLDAGKGDEGAGDGWWPAAAAVVVTGIADALWITLEAGSGEGVLEEKPGKPLWTSFETGRGEGEALWTSFEAGKGDGVPLWPSFEAGRGEGEAETEWGEEEEEFVWTRRGRRAAPSAPGQAFIFIFQKNLPG